MKPKAYHGASVRMRGDDRSTVSTKERSTNMEPTRARAASAKPTKAAP